MLSIIKIVLIPTFLIPLHKPPNIKVEGWQNPHKYEIKCQREQWYNKHH